jgi:hypothetical protein
MIYNSLRIRTNAEIKRILQMRHSNETINFVRNLVAYHATLDRLSQCYTLDVNHLPDFTKSEFAALLMLDDEMYASEATGADNQSFEHKMLPALINLLKRSTDRDEEIHFVSEWKEGVTNYFKKTMQMLIDLYCGELQCERATA